MTYDEFLALQSGRPVEAVAEANGARVSEVSEGHRNFSRTSSDAASYRGEGGKWARRESGRTLETVGTNYRCATVESVRSGSGGMGEVGREVEQLRMPWDE